MPGINTPALNNSSGGGGSSSITSLLGITSSGQKTMANSLSVAIASDNTGPVEVWDGTNIVNILKSDGTAAGQNALIVAGGFLPVSFTTTSVQAVGSTDAGNYRNVSVQITSQGGSSTVNFQGSNDNSTWVAVTLTSGGSGVASTVNTGIFYGALNYRYFRLNVTGIVSGTTAGVIDFFSNPVGQTGVNQYGTWTVGSNSATGSAVPANAFYIAVNSGGNLVGLNLATGNGDNQGFQNGLVTWNETFIHNGTNWDRIRTANSGQGTTGVGVLGAAILGFDGTNYQRISTNSTTYTSKFGLDNNLLGTLGTAFTDAGKVNVQGGVATNVAVADKLLNLGAQAISSENTAVTATRMAQLVTDLVGKLIVLPYANPENFVSGRATATDTTSTSLIGAPASGLRNYITHISVWNSSATSTYIKIQDGSGGTELYDVPAPAGGGASFTLPTPLRQPTTATALFFAANASANAVFISCSGYKGV